MVTVMSPGITVGGRGMNGPSSMSGGSAIKI